MIPVKVPPAWLWKRVTGPDRDPLRIFQALSDEFGPLVRMKLGTREFFLVNDEPLIRDLLITQGAKFEKFPRIERTKGLFGDGLLTSEEPLHLRQRRLVQPGFHRSKLQAYAAEMAACIARYESHLTDGEERDLAVDLSHLALDIVSRTLFSADTARDAEAVARSLETVLLMLNELVLPLGPLKLSLPLPATRRYFRALSDLDAIIFRIIQDRISGDEDRDDLLSMLLAARDPESGQPMSRQQLRDEVITLFVAGHETTANALAWTFYLLAQHPEVRERLAVEAATVLQDREPAADDYPHLAYSERVFTESMRLFPSVWILGRRALQPYSFNGLQAPAGSVFLVCMKVLHQQAAYFDQAGTFDPDRWLPERRASVPKYAYLPFGAGSRLCVGERFAWMEGVLILSALARRWRFDLTPQPPIEPLGLLTLRPKHGLKVRVSRR